MKVYKVVETIQKDHVCNQVISSAGQFENIKSKAGKRRNRCAAQDKREEKAHHGHDDKLSPEAGAP